MNGGKKPHGYTIVEVMIVLAISGVMLAIAATFISGKQARASFSEGSNEFTTAVQTMISQVTNGQFSDVALGCTAGGSSLSITNSVSQPDCVFIGKFLHISEGGDPTKYEIFSLAGARAATSLATSLVTPITGSADITNHQVVPQSLKITSVSITDCGAASITAYGFGFVQSYGTEDTSSCNHQAGAGAVSLVYSPSVNASNLNSAAAAGAITNKLTYADSASICITDGKRFATVLISDANGGSQLSANLKVVQTC